MRLRFVFTATAALLTTSAMSAAGQGIGPHAVRTLVRSYQGRDRGPEQTDRVSAKYRIGRDGRVSVTNISGEIAVTGGSGDEVSVEAVKRTRGDRSRLGDVRIETSNAAGRVEIRTEYPRMSNTNVSVDYTLTVPAGVSLELHSVSGDLKVTGVRGTVRLETISGSVTGTDTPNVELAKSVSGDISLSGISTEQTLTAGSISGAIAVKGVKARRLELSSVSGDVVLTDVNAASVHAKSISGGFEYTGVIAKGGEYDVNVHSGTIRFSLSNPSGFYLNADTFSGSIQTDFPITIGGTTRSDSGNDRGRRRMSLGQSVHGTNGDGSATLTLRTFSGSIVISKR